MDPAAQKFSRSLTGSRRNRLWLLLVASIAVVILTLAALWLSDYFGEVEAQAAPKISASEMFAAECQLVREEQLKILHLIECEVNDDMLTDIAELDWVDTVILDRGTITDKGLESIAKLPNLKHLTEIVPDYRRRSENDLQLSVAVVLESSACRLQLGRCRPAAEADQLRQLHSALTSG